MRGIRRRPLRCLRDSGNLVASVTSEARVNGGANLQWERAELLEESKAYKA